MTDPTATYRLRTSSGEEYGPGTIEQLCEWARQGRVPRDALLVHAESGEPKSVLAVPELAAILAAPPMTAGALPEREASDATGGIIPYKNPPALIGYYTAVFSLIPCFGLVAGPIAIGLGIGGLRKRAKDPRVRGAAHAWVAIVLGLITAAANAFAIVLYSSYGP